MNPNIYELSKMTKEQYDFIMKRAELDITEQMKVAKEVSDDVKARGDEAVLEYTAKFDRVQLTADKMKVTPEEIEAGYNNLDKETREAIEYAYKNIYDFHEKQLPEEMWFTMVDDGLMVGEKTTPIVDVCLYVPHGKGSFPSVLCMLGIPAVVAKVPKIVVVTPPNEKGEVDDAILAAAASVMALQSIPSRQNDPLDSLVVTVGMMNGGTKENIVCDHVELVGTVRAFNREFRNSMPERIRQVGENVVQGYGCTAECDYYFGPSPLINDDRELVELAKGAAKAELGDACLRPLPKMTGAEDFSVFMEHIPGVYGYLGFKDPGSKEAVIHHHPAFDVDESVLHHGAGIYVRFAVDYLEKNCR